MVVLVSGVHGACDHVGHGLGGVVDHRHLGNLLLDRSVAVNTGSKLDSLGVEYQVRRKPKKIR